MKLPDYARAIGISYTTAWRWWKAGKLPHPARQTESGLVIVDYVPVLSSVESARNRVAIYSRVSYKREQRKSGSSGATISAWMRRLMAIKLLESSRR